MVSVVAERVVAATSAPPIHGSFFGDARSPCAHLFDCQTIELMMQAMKNFARMHDDIIKNV